MVDASKVVDEHPDDSGDSANVIILRRHASNLEQMSNLVLYKIDQRKITQDTIDTLVESLSEIIGSLDRLRYVFDIDQLHSSLDEVQEHITDARECLFVASYILEKTNKRASDITLLHQNYDIFTKFLSDAIELLRI
jgi:hypothetical protein